MTSELFVLNALCTSIACGMLNLADTGFSSLKVLASLNLCALAIKLKDDEFDVMETLKSNRVLAVETAVLLYLAYVE